ncbi:hypothetical protein TNCV_4093001 [Trichonephila clavipes]|nr:hypothetical protein TNCV_4093001 [Trichonephila clavipes]
MAKRAVTCSRKIRGGLVSNPGEGMDICKCILPLRHEGTQRSSRKTSRKVGRRGKRCDTPLTTPRMFSLKIGVELSQIVLSPGWCSKLRITIGVQLTPCRDEFRGP